MTSVTGIYEYAVLASVAYVPLRAGLTEAERGVLLSSRFASDQVDDFVSLYPEIVAQYNDGEGTSLSATVVRSAIGELSVSFRGTVEFIGDILPTDADIFVGGAGYDQIVAMVNWWKSVTAQAGTTVEQYRLALRPADAIPQGAVVLSSDGQQAYVLEDAPEAVATGTLHGQVSPSRKVNVTGHSLGGHLAMAFSSIFSGHAEEVVVFNAPGFKDTAENQAFFQKLGGSVPNSPSIINVAADESRVGESGFYAVARLHSEPGQLINVAIENQLGADEPDPFFGAWNHSMTVLTDSLAVYSLLADLDPALSEESYKAILNRVAQGTAGGYERVGLPPVSRTLA